MGISGAMRRDELTKMSIDDIKDEHSNRANILYCMRGTPRHSSTPIRLNVEYRAPIALALAQPFKTDLPCKSRIISNNIPLPSRRAGDDCADMTCYNPGSPKLPEIHRYDCACTKFNPLTGRMWSNLRALSLWPNCTVNLILPLPSRLPASYFLAQLNTFLRTFQKLALFGCTKLRTKDSNKNCKANFYITSRNDIIESNLNHNHDPSDIYRQKISNSVKRKAEEDISVRPTKLIHREIKEAALLECEKQVFPIGQSLIVWDEMWLLCYGVVMPGLKEDISESRLVFIQGNLTAIRYVQEVLRPVVVPYFRRVNNALFQQDNARPHIANVSRDFLDDSQVDLLPWPPRSPDLSPIEHVWDLMGRRLTNLHNPPLTLAALRHEIQVAWDSVPQDEINYLIRRFKRQQWAEYASSSHNVYCKTYPDVPPIPLMYKLRNKQNRSLIATMLRLQTQHARNPTHLFRLGIKNSPLCECGEVGTLNHIIFSCPQNNPHTQLLLRI
ncbi:hypothetical protein GEV33_008751 [Tenebrio molitor]|uniref:Tc1-like transposase DDE domain-containing protein n=1 Tax=Tenebrio molitor TaxID=7067 RepID=A0A8J6LAB6_TENMO|nr:hypothetical protein GEV33_008751 [Tenebrio molitor]